MSDTSLLSADTISAPRLTFGIYPGSAAGGGPFLFPGPADDPAHINAALSQLQPAGRPFLVRGYLHYIGAGTIASQTPADMAQYAREGRQLDLVLCFRSPDGDLADWAEVIRATIRKYGSALAKIQIAEEPNNPNPAAGGDGSSPNVRQAIVAGVLAAKDEARRLGYTLQVGFNATPTFGPTDEFWPGMAALAEPSFLAALDYVGLDFFPGVFRPLPQAADGSPIALRDAVTGVLRYFRNVNLATGKIPARVPIHITEHGWPTNADRPEAQQAEGLEEVIRVIHRQSRELNITHYEFFDLRDTDSAEPGFQFGLLRDDYTPKPAFERYRQLIAELG